MLYARANALYREDANKPLRKSHDNPYIKVLYEEFLGHPLSHQSEQLLHTHYFNKSTDAQLSCTATQQLIDICKRHGNDPGELINILHEAQHLQGYLPEETQRIIATQLGIPVSRVYGVVTFYTFFTMKPKGKHPISVCMGTACYVRGSEKLLEEFKRTLGIEVGQTTPDGRFSLDCLRCVGACGLAPVVLIGDKVYGRLQPTEVKRVISEITD
ncbi:MAG: NADH-quinone oxidoreductase subunit NuoE [Mediterranea sp.]|nr:NADH-quinone oxidoreductase subunit NuoE [Mediterranea sp.]